MKNVLELIGITKRFPGVLANDKIEFFHFSSPLKNRGFRLANESAQPFDFASIRPLFSLCKPEETFKVYEGIYLFGHFR